jgi:hypothetical protein
VNCGRPSPARRILLLGCAERHTHVGVPIRDVPAAQPDKPKHETGSDSKRVSGAPRGVAEDAWTESDAGRRLFNAHSSGRRCRFLTYTSSRAFLVRRYHVRKTRHGVQATIIPSKKLCDSVIFRPIFLKCSLNNKPPQRNRGGASSRQIRKLTELFCGYAALHARSSTPCFNPKSAGRILLCC